MISQNKILFILLLSYFLVISCSSEPHKIIHFSYHRISKKYNWGKLDVVLSGTYNYPSSKVTIRHNPYNLYLIIEKSKDKGESCIAKLKYLALYDFDDNLKAFETNNKQSKFSYSSKKDYWTQFQVDNLDLNYKKYKIMFQLDIICNNKLIQTVEEKDFIFNKDYREEDITGWDIIMGV